MSSRFLERALLIVLTALVLLWAPLWNGYPFIHSDTGTYLWSSINFGVPLDRPIGYSLIIRAATLVPSSWMIALVQALGTAYLMLRVAEGLLPATKRRLWVAFGIALVVSLVTTVSLFVSFILADILAAWLWLATVLFIISPYRFERVLAALAIVASIISHNSHVLLAAGLAVSLGVAVFVAPRLRSRVGKRALGYVGVLAFSLVGMVGVNWWLNAPPAPTRGGDTILLGRFHEMGVLTRMLDENCAAKGWELCSLLDVVRQHDREWRWFLHGSDSPILKVGWDTRTAEQRAMVVSMLSCCWQTIVGESLAESARQFALIEMRDYIKPHPENMVALTALRSLYPNEWETYRASAQQRNAAPTVWLLPVQERAMQWFWVGAAFVVTFLAVWRKQPMYTLWLVTTLGYVAWNAFVMATFSGAVTRYQARVAWLIPFAVLVAACGLVMEWRTGAKARSLRQ